MSSLTTGAILIASGRVPKIDMTLILPVILPVLLSEFIPRTCSTQTPRYASVHVLIGAL
mgnify:CR=1 FL=1